MYTVIAHLLTINAHITSILCIVPNVLVVFLILSTKHSEIHEYRWIMAVQSSLELITCLTLSLLDLGFYEEDDVVYFVQKGLLSLTGRFLPLLGWVLVIFLFSCKIFVVLLIFIFRYTFICNKVYLKGLFKFRGALVVFAFVTVISASIAMISACGLTIGHYERFDVIFATNDTLTFFFEKRYTVSGVLCVTVGGLIIFATYTVVFYTSTRIIRITKAARASERTRYLQRQLTIVMLLQALLPQIFIIFPVLFLLAVMLTPVHIGIYASIVPILFNWEPCAYPFIAIYFVRPFRERLFSMFSLNTIREFLLCRHQQNSTPVTRVTLYA